MSKCRVSVSASVGGTISVCWWYYDCLSVCVSVGGPSSKCLRVRWWYNVNVSVGGSQCFCSLSVVLRLCA
jgi:hypothetical protein